MSYNEPFEALNCDSTLQPVFLGQLHERWDTPTNEENNSHT
jgi:hypothetical protein